MTLTRRVRIYIKQENKIRMSQMRYDFRHDRISQTKESGTFEEDRGTNQANRNLFKTKWKRRKRTRMRNGFRHYRIPQTLKSRTLEENRSTNKENRNIYQPGKWQHERDLILDITEYHKLWNPEPWKRIEKLTRRIRII